MPEGYFVRSAKTIQQKLEWQDEHANFPHLLSLGRTSGFSVPKQFFESSEVRLEQIAYPILAGVKKENPFVSPDQYFESSAAELSHLPFAHEADTSRLNAIEKKFVFETPQQYFETNSLRLQTLLEDHKGGTVLQLFRSRIAFAAAAMLLIALGLWWFNTRSASSLTQDCGSMACLDKSDLVKTNNLENLDDEELYELVNSNELEKILSSPVEPSNSSKDSSQQEPDMDTDALLDEI